MRTAVVAMVLLAAGSCYGFEITYRGYVADWPDSEGAMPGDLFEFTYVCSEYWIANRAPGVTMWYFDIKDMYGRTYAADDTGSWVEWKLHRKSLSPHAITFTDNEKQSSGVIQDGYWDFTTGGVVSLIPMVNVTQCDDNGCVKRDNYFANPQFTIKADAKWFDGMPDMQKFVLPSDFYSQVSIAPVYLKITDVLFKWPEPGDANQDFIFDEMDIVQVAEAAKYMTGDWATWAQGDWNDDEHFNNLDIVAALATGNYLQGPYKAMAVPELGTAQIVIETALLIGITIWLYCLGRKHD